TASRAAGNGTLQGTTAQTASAGVATFTDLSHTVATNITIVFSGSGLTNATSSTIAVLAAAASTLAFSVQPANATAGSVFGTQPVVVTRDAFGNNSKSGLAGSLSVALTLSSGNGPLQGVLTANIGTSAGNGTINFAGLRLDAAGP